MLGLGNNVKLSCLMGQVDNTTGSTDTTAPGYVDMSGYDSVLLIGVPSEVIATAVMGIYAYTGDTVATLAATTSVYSGTTSATTSMEQMVFALDLVKPQRRYISARWDKATAASGGAIIALQYNGTEKPATQSTDVFGCLNVETFAGAT